jgi:hypothetical protein
MNTDAEGLLSNTDKKPPCPPRELVDFLERVGPIPHQDYLDFIANHNGCSGPVGADGYLSLWPADEVVSRTEDLAEFAPGLLLFASDGGNEAFAFDKRHARWPIVMVPMIGISHEDAIPVAATFTELVRRLAAGDDLFRR